MSIRTKLLIILMMFAIVPAIIYAIWIYQEARVSLLAVREAQLNSIADLTKEKIETFFKERQADVATMANFSRIRKNLPTLALSNKDPSNPKSQAVLLELDQQIKHFQQQYGYHDILLADPEGTVVYVSNEAHASAYLGKPFEDQQLFEKAKEDKAFSQVRPHQVQGSAIVLFVAAPVLDLNEQFAGEVIFLIDLGPTSSSITSTTGLGETGEVVIAKKEGKQALFLFPLRSNPNAALKTFTDLGEAKGAPIQNATLGKNGSGLAQDYRGIPVLAAWRHLPMLHWGLVTKIDVTEVFAPIAMLRNIMVFIGLGLLAIGMLMAIFVALSITNPIKKLQQGAMIISAGNLNHEVATNALDEIGQFSRAFSLMTHHLREKVAEQERTAEDLRMAREDLEKRVKERTLELTHANQALRMAGTYNRNLIEASLDPLVTIRPDGRITDVNEATERITGLTRQEIISTDFADYFTDPEKAREGYHKAFLEGSVRDFALEIRSKQGQVTPVLYNATTFKTEAGEVKGVFAAARDITELRKSEEILKKSEERFRLTLDQMKEGCMIIGFDWKYLYVNETAALHGHQKRENLLGRTMLEMYPGVEKTDIFAAYQRCMEKRERQQIESEYTFPDGSKNWYEFSVEPVPEGIFVLSLDITERKQAGDLIQRSHDELEARVLERTADLKRAYDQLESANQELGDFAHIVSHDLKAPLRAISTLASMLATDYQERFDTEGKEQLGLLVGRVKRMYSLIEGILQYSRVGRAKETLERVDLNEVMSQVLDLISPSNNIKVVVDNSLPVITGERTRLLQVFQNLVGNAVKFMDKPQGEIHVGSCEENGYYKFFVADNGPGVEEKHFDRIFKIFQTLNTRDELESTGIGLAIVKKIVEGYKGKIWVESIVDRGTTFFFTLPTEKKEL